jgi:hypothetical protein
MLEHLGIQSLDPARATSFYDAVLAPLGGVRLMEPSPGVVGYGGADREPDFWVGPLEVGTENRPIHVAFVRDPDGNNVEAVCHTG